MRRYQQRLARLARAYRDAEARVVAAFFKQAHEPGDHLRWLKAQAYKEHSAIRPLLANLDKLYPELDRTVDRRDFEETIAKLADETRHSRLVIGLAEALAGKKMTPADLPWLPEDRKLARVRARYSKTVATLLHGNGRIARKEIQRGDEQIERAALTLTEGGGGALYRVCSRLSKPGIERKIARVFKDIMRDEQEHQDAGARALARLIRNEAGFRKAARIIAVVSRQRLRMRNEQFGFPLTAAEIEALDRRARQRGGLC